jgi:uncharacterized protein (TIGR00661 family)
MENEKKILVCPLNWGLGHASRCIPLIRQLLHQQKEVLIATDGYPLELLKNEFPELTCINFPSYTIQYSESNSQLWAIIRLLPAIIKRINTEHRQLKKIIQAYSIDTVLSDNRFGLWNKNIRSLYMTHQLMIKMPRRFKWIEPVISKIHHFFIQQYDVCLIPDKFENGGYAGDLTHKYKLPGNARFIGILSRFDGTHDGAKSHSLNNATYEIMAVLSGVEPQRALLEEILIKSLSQQDIHSLVVQGLPQEEQKIQQTGKVTVVSHLSSTEMEHYLRDTPIIICRSGYSSIMDLIALNKTALLVPTPGQTEQEYLARYLSDKDLFTTVKQDKLSLKLKLF